MGLMGDGSGAEAPGLGDRLRHARLRRGLSREELAVNAAISWSGIAQIESGRRRNVRPDTLMALAEALEVTTDYLVAGAESRPVMLTHRALLYDSDESFVNTVGPLLAEGIERDEPAFVTTSDANIDLVREFLGGRQRQVEYLSAEDLYGTPGEAFSTYRGFVDRELRRGAPWTTIVGEPVWTRRSEASLSRAESLANIVFADLPVTLVCGYDRRRLAPSILRHACATHPETISDGHVESSSEYVEPQTFVLRD